MQTEAMQTRPSPSRKRIAQLSARLAELERGPDKPSPTFELPQTPPPLPSSQQLRASDGRAARTWTWSAESTGAESVRDQLHQARAELASEASSTRSLLDERHARERSLLESSVGLQLDDDRATVRARLEALLAAVDQRAHAIELELAAERRVREIDR